MIAGPVASLTAAIVLTAGSLTLSSDTDSGTCWPTAFRCHALDQLRHDAGLPGLDQDRDLQDYAETWAEHMTSGQVLEHSGGSYSETVGMGPDWRTVFAMFMASPEHRAILLDPGLTEVGIGTQRDAERVWITLVFR